MIDNRIILDELVIECREPWPAGRGVELGRRVAQALAQELATVQQRRLRDIRRGAAVPGVLRVERLCLRLSDPNASPVTIARTVRDALVSAWRCDEQPV
ncbi:hypothetical protein [Nannocystis punicea]|uniref:Uncharacterized protein n=1 Tax=Nannocystis punicea TaxID=2995304 RepID=A0ABY7H6C7_9BACT|nr:hypothetical protein [Nannocystis poenicansa]WAS94829.1 hypothetical protein O0S08_01600 [Nannocystis poenicansa]